MKPQENQPALNLFLRFNEQEIREMTPEYFEYIIEAFWNEVKDVVTQDEFVALGTALAVRKIKKTGNLANTISIRKRIRNVIK